MDVTPVYPQTIPCDRCGRTASIINATPIYANADALLKADATHVTTDLSCRINCPYCGLQVQVVRATE
jgi:endogenous inhibitor of DNA gyrase (YacG/DUF329 family)